METALILIGVIACYYIYRKYKFNPKSVAKKRVLLTGASSGIGEHIAYRYAELGARLLLTARRNHLLKEVAEKCLEKGAEEVHVVVADMADPVDREKLVVETKKIFQKGLDFLILNHAIMSYNWWHEMQDAVNELQEIMTVNFISYAHLTTLLMDSLEVNGGHICAVSSISGKFGVIGMTPYSASKHALQGFFSSLRQELRIRKSGVTVSLAVFGPIKSEHGVQLFHDHTPTIAPFSASVEGAADVLIKGTANGEFEIIFPLYASFVVFLKRLFPHLFEYVSSIYCNLGK